MAASFVNVFRAWLLPEPVVGRPLPNPVADAGPYFIIFLVIEFAASILMGKKVYNIRQTVSNLSAGTFLSFSGVFLKSLFIFPFMWVRQYVAVVPDASGHGWLLPVLGFLLTDHSYYWFHRTAHMSNLGWAGHVTHHSSCDYNLSTALRQGVGESTYSWLFYLILAPFVPLDAALFYKGLNTVIQFWVHTELIPKLWAPIEFVFNTPSHHRVHHARNYGRANFGGVFIVWDRLYGTFESEQDDRPCIYGLDNRRVPLGTWSPLWHQAHHLVATLRLAASDPRHAWAALFTRRYGPGMVVPAVVDAVPDAPKKIPDWIGLDPDPTRPNGWFPWDRRPWTVLDWYAVLHFGLGVVPATVWLSQAQTRLTAGQAAICASAGIASLITVVTVMDKTRAALRWELVRLGAAAALLPVLEGRLGMVGETAGNVSRAVIVASALLLMHQHSKLGLKAVNVEEKEEEACGAKCQ